jgi:hypothetical protein
MERVCGAMKRRVRVTTTLKNLKNTGRLTKSLRSIGTSWATILRKKY